MFSDVRVEAPDMIMSLWADFQADSRADKLDLGIGVYRAADGTTPIMAAVREAQKLRAETETTKAYLSPLGDPVFATSLTRIVLGEDTPQDRISAIQTPGGSGALSLGAALLGELTRRGGTVLVPVPTWVNHAVVLRSAGLTVETYPYFDAATGRVDLAAMLDRLDRAEPGTIVLLHGCCHNPTGANLDRDGWKSVSDVIARRRLFPFVDLAYQGLGDGLEEDAFGARLLVRSQPEALVAVSCSKNFAIYRERTGILIAATKGPAEAVAVRSRLAAHARITYSMPPDHGAAIVRIILGDPALKETWRSELDAMRNRIASLRAGLVDAFRARTNSDRYDFLGTNRGMFSLIGVTTEQAKALRARHGIYVVDDGRINVAGLRHEVIDRFVEAVVAETGGG